MAFGGLAIRNDERWRKPWSVLRQDWLGLPCLPRNSGHLARRAAPLATLFFSAAGFFACVARGLSRRLLSGKFAAFPGRPTGLIDLAAAADSQAVVGHVFGDGRARGDISVVPDVHRGHENRIAGAENAFADGRGRHLEATVLAGHPAPGYGVLTTDSINVPRRSA